MLLRWSQAEKLRAERERATGDFGGSRHLLALQMRMLSEQVGGFGNFPVLLLFPSERPSASPSGKGVYEAASG